MEHKKDSDYLSDMQDDGDFDNLLKEKLKGWKGPTVSEILDEQVTIPIKKTEPKLPVESVVVESSVTSNSSETSGTEESSKPTDAQVVDVNTDSELKSDPDLTRAILDGQHAENKLTRVEIRGIKTGAWAKPEAFEKTLPESEVLKELGYVTQAEIWRKSKEFFVRKCANDPAKIVAQIQMLDKAAFTINAFKLVGREHLKEALAHLSEDERNRELERYNKARRGKSDIAKPQTEKTEKKKGLTKAKIDGLEGMIALGATMETLLNMLKASQPTDMLLQVEWINKRFAKG